MKSESNLLSAGFPGLHILYMLPGLLFCIFPCIHAQKGNISIEGDSLTLEQAFEQVESQSFYTIAYNRSRLDVSKKRSLSIRNATIEEALTSILKGSGWSYYIEQKHIILIKEKDKPSGVMTWQIRGQVLDRLTRQPIPFATVIIRNEEGRGGLSDEKGYFVLNNLSPGRYDIKVTCMGYQPFIYNEIILTSGKVPFIEIPLTEQLFHLNEITVRPQNKKEQPVNPMVWGGGRRLSMEEGARFAGGFDDPARLVTSFAGVSGGVGDNSVVIHGNAPHLLQWRVEGMEIANPNHFADLTTMGGGIFSSISSHMLGNSDFLTGAYPAEYGNAFSGIFDMHLRTGNNQNYESIAEVNLTGISIASEGPFKKGKKGSYLFNYRNATFACIRKFIPDMEINNFGYQDLSFKLYFPYSDRASLSLWGVGLMDKNYEKFERYPEEWSPTVSKMGISGNQYMASAGLRHTYGFKNKASLRTSLGLVYINNDLAADSIESIKVPNLNLHNRSFHLNATTHFNYKINARHTNKSGITWTSMFYHFFYNELDPEVYRTLQRKISGHTGTLSAFSNSVININERMKLNLGLNGQVFLLNKNRTIEPRLAVEYALKADHSLVFAYGLHSRLERLTTYFIKSGNGFPNKELDFIRSHQFVLSYLWKISDVRSLKIESYYHSLFHIPMVSGTSYSTLNGLSFLINVPLSNEGKGVNKGVDVTFERYLSDGYYYLWTASLYDSKYCGKDRVWFNTRYNYRFLTDLLAGKEWIFGNFNQHLIGTNIKFTLRGGERYTPVNKEASLKNSSLVTYEDQMYKSQFAPKLRVDLTVNYRLNKKSVVHDLSFKILNLTGITEYYRHRFDHENQSITKDDIKIILPNLSYKISF